VNSALRRWQGHKVPSKKHGKLAEAIQEGGEADFKITELRTTLCRDKADLLEQNYIRDLNCLYPGGFNSQSGGKSGFKITDRTRERLRVSHRGIPQSPETVEKRASALRGRKRDPEMIAISAEKRRGAKRSAQFSADCRERALNQMTPQRREVIRQQQLVRWQDPVQRDAYISGNLRRMQDPIHRAVALKALEKGRAVRYRRAYLKGSP